MTPVEADTTSGSLEFYGVNVAQNYVKNEFLLTASIALGKFSDIVESTTRIYAGAHRQNFDGGVLQKSNVKVSSVRFWFDYLPDETIRKHAFDTENYGTEHPYRNAFLFQPEGKKFDFFATGSKYVPQMETLALHWDFATLTGSDDSGEFTVVDVSSGSVDSIRYGYQMSDDANVITQNEYSLTKALKRQHSGKGKYFPSNNPKVVDKIYVSNAI